MSHFSSSQSGKYLQANPKLGQDTQRRYNLLCSGRKYNIDNEIIKPLKTGITELVKEFGKGIDIDQESKAILNGKMPAEAKGFVGGFDYMDSSSAGAPQTVMFVAPITKV